MRIYERKDTNDTHIVVVKEVAQELGVNVPSIRRVYKWLTFSG